MFSLGFEPRIKSVFHIVFFLQTHIFFAQENLVPNGSFEEYLTCPSSIPPYYYVDRANNWFMPTTGSSDYFNACSTEFDSFFNSYMFSVPQNYIGNQDAHTGVAYAGYYGGFTPSNNNNYEYLSVKLNKKLEKDKVYRITYFLSLADSTISLSNGVPQQFGNHTAALLSESINFQNNDNMIGSTPQFISDPNIMLNDSLGWQKVEGYIISAGNEEYLTIGFFCSFEDLTLNYFDGIDVAIYYYIDDVSLNEVNIDFPNVFTPNDDGFNDFLDFNFYTKEMEISIMNRWGTMVFNSSESNTLTWNGTVNGKNCEEGIYFYNLKIGNIKKTGFVELMR